MIEKVMKITWFALAGLIGVSYSIDIIDKVRSRSDLQSELARMHIENLKLKRDLDELRID